MNEKKVINFYSTRDAYGCFSNFSRHHLFLKDKVWKTSEHYFQAQKFAGTEYEEKVRLAHSPKEAAELGRNRKFPLRKDWEAVKDDIMREALRAKFTQNKELKEILLKTGDIHLVEHTHNDFYWADGGDGSGKNMLGKLLMELREELNNE
jgi:N-glycosidase YbiA